MNILDSQISLVGALSGWGLHEVQVGKCRVEISSDAAQREVLGMETVLRHVPELIARILLAEPLAAIRVDFG